MHRRALALAFVAVLLLAAAAHAASAPDKGMAFEPHPVSQPLYGTKTPDKDPATQEHYVTAHDGVQIYVETWVPAAKDGNVPPAHLPTILVATPYATQGVSRYVGLEPNDLIPYFTARGYAVAQENVRGTGESGGCLEQTSTNQIDDTARVIEYLGRDVSWADGNVGMYGKSYDGETQVSTAALGGAARTKYLKAIVPIESVGGQYEYSNMDGVPFAGQAALSDGGYLAVESVADQGKTVTLQMDAEKLSCLPDVAPMAADPTGDMNPNWQTREYRPGAKNITAATLWVHGFDDFNVLPVTIAGFFDRLPASTPHVGLFGQWQHEYPDNHPETEPQWDRADFFGMVTAWYDRYLKGLDSGVESWPRVQVQDNLGQWRAEPNFPYNAGAPVGQLALGSNGKLGDTAPTGSDSYVAGKDTLTYDTAAVSAPLHVTGLPIADLWLTTSLPTGQVMTSLQVLDASGNAINAHSITYGGRSLRHLDPMPDGYFVQQHGTVPAVNTPIRVAVKLMPVDLTVPAGGKLRLTIDGLTGVRTILPTGLGAQVSILHDCQHPSALRFEMPRTDAPLLNVRETDEAGKTLSSTAATAGVQDGGGAAAVAVCGHGPFDPQGLLTGELVTSYEGPAAAR